MNEYPNEGRYRDEDQYSGEGRYSNEGQYGSEGRSGGRSEREEDRSQSRNENQSGGMFDQARNAAEGQVDNVIDQYASKVPGGEQYKQQAKDFASKGLDRIEEEGKKHSGSILDEAKRKLGGLFGGGKKPEE